MNILFVVPPPDFYLSMNLGVAILSKMAIEAGHNVEVLDLNIDLYQNGEINKYSWCRDLNFHWEKQEVVDFIWDSSLEVLSEDALNKIKFKTIDMVCIRLTDLSYLMAEKLAGWFRNRYKNIKIIGGGPYTWTAKDKLKSFDEILQGYAEERFSKIIDSDKYSGAYNLDFSHDYEYIYPDTFPIETSRGCPHKCIFCCERKFCNFQIFPYEVVENNIKNISASYNNLYFVDSLINPTLKHLNKILDYVERYELTLNCNLTPITLDSASIIRLKNLAGRVFLGIETFSQTYADKLNKPGHRSLVIKNLELMRKYGLKVETGIIISGPPFQTESDLSYDISLLKEFKDVFSKVILSPLRIFEMADISKCKLNVPSPVRWWENSYLEVEERLNNFLFMTQELEDNGVKTETNYSGSKKFIDNILKGIE